MSPRPTTATRTGRWSRRVVAVVAIGLMAACAETGDTADGPSGKDPTPPTSEPAAVTTSAGAELRLVALGDSISTDNQCPGCTTFADLYGQLAQRETGQTVVVQNLSVPDTAAADLLEQVTHDPATREALVDADLVTVTIGFNDTPWNRLDDPCGAAPDYPSISWPEVTPGCTDRVTREFAGTFDEILAEITRLHGSGPLTLRVTTVYNSVIGDTVDPTWDSPEAVAPSKLANQQFADAQCRVASKYGGRCARMIPLMNGADGASDAGANLAADHTHMSQQGHQLTADALAALGF
jgi:lysophospholipase L1-like esterase